MLFMTSNRSFYTSPSKMAMVLFVVASSLLSSPSLFAPVSAAPKVGDNQNEWNVNTIFEPGTEIPAKTKLSECVDTLATLLDIHPETMKTDPEVLKDILSEDMHLNDNTEVLKLLGSDLTVPRPLKPMLDQVREGITSVHPALGVTLCSALADKPTSAALFSSTPNAELIKRTINHMYLLEKIVAHLADDVEFMIHLQKHMKDTVQSMTRHKSTIGHVYDLFRAAGMFGVAKAYTINGAMDDYVEFRQRGTMTESESEGRKQGLTLNILEATTNDFLHGYFSNARVGHALAWQHPSSVEVVGTHKEIAYVGPMSYAQLYETWNFAFITGNLDYPNLLYPKLLIPSVILAGSNAYLFKRVLALWLSINFYLMADLSGHKHVTFDGRSELTTLWGKINLRYSSYLDAKQKADAKARKD